MINALVVGACGRMGNTIIRLINDSKDIRLSGATERKEHPLLGKDVGEVLGLGKMEITLADKPLAFMEETDVLIDFTDPRTSLGTLKIAADKKKAAVIGSTGFSPDESKEMEKLAGDIPCIISPNMSIGVNLMFKLISSAAEVLKDEYDVEMIEAHHRMKKDAPSGTALRMARILADTLNRDLEKVGVYQRKGWIGERSPEEIGIQTIRAGDIVGDHTVIFGGIGERIEITHRAHSRDTFGKGAVRAAQWVVGKPAGIYNVFDVLELR